MLTELSHDHALAVVRADRIPEPELLCAALAAGGIRLVELTFTTPDIENVIARAVAYADHSLVGAGTVTDAARARAAIDAGARFLVTPGISAEVADIAHEAGIPVMMGAMTPSEVALAGYTLQADAVKIFPASTVGPAHLKALHGPFPDLKFVPSGGIDAHNAAEFIAAGALAVTAGTSVVSAALIDAGDWDEITLRAREFTMAAHG